MNFQFLVFLLLLVIPNYNVIYAENSESNLENSSDLIEEKRLSHSSKIHPILIKWQTAENPNKFAKENNLAYSENKIEVYIYLESVQSRSKIPSEIKTTAFVEKIVVAFVSSEQINKLEKMDFVEKIMTPDYVRTTSLPKVEIQETESTKENQHENIIWIVFGGIIIFSIITVIKKRQKHQEMN